MCARGTIRAKQQALRYQRKLAVKGTRDELRPYAADGDEGSPKPRSPFIVPLLRPYPIYWRFVSPIVLSSAPAAVSGSRADFDLAVGARFPRDEAATSG